MPVIPAPHEHLKAALDAIDEHQAHHEARIAHHQGEIDALLGLRARYRDVLGQVAPDDTTAGPLEVVRPKTGQQLIQDITFSGQAIVEGAILPAPIGAP